MAGRRSRHKDVYARVGHGLDRIGLGWIGQDFQETLWIGLGGLTVVPFFN